MKEPSRILCVGAAHWDVIARADGSLRAGDDVPGRIEDRPGGVALNVALGLARLGGHVLLCSVVGDDEAGVSLIRRAEAEGVDCAHVVTTPHAPTNRYVAIENGDGDLFAAVADTGSLEAHGERVVAQASRALSQVDTLFLDANLDPVALEALARRAGASGIEVVANPVSPAKAPRLAGLLAAEPPPTIVANLQEARALLGNSAEDAAIAAGHLLTRGAHTALVTNGWRPAALATGSGVATSIPMIPERDISVTGAGDALLAAFLACRDRHNDPDGALSAALQAAAEHLDRGL